MVDGVAAARWKTVACSAPVGPGGHRGGGPALDVRRADQGIRVDWQFGAGRVVRFESHDRIGGSQRSARDWGRAVLVPGGHRSQWTRRVRRYDRWNRLQGDFAEVRLRLDDEDAHL